MLTDPKTWLTPRALGVDAGDRLENAFAVATALDPGARPGTIRGFWTEFEVAAQAASSPRIEAARALPDPIATPLAVSMPVGTPLPSSPDPVRDVSAVTAGVGVVACAGCAVPHHAPNNPLLRIVNRKTWKSGRFSRLCLSKRIMEIVFCLSAAPRPWRKICAKV
ncbi:MAG: hypothetical protein KDD89_10640 [Anaerolineales bacterium]|nr:hypothetical protein [Anaerolineales bacterium]